MYVCLYKIRTYANFQRYFCTDFHARGCPPLPSTGCGVRRRRAAPRAAWLICVRTSSSSFSVYPARYPTRPCKVKEEAYSGNGFLDTCCPIFSRKEYKSLVINCLQVRYFLAFLVQIDSRDLARYSCLPCNSGKQKCRNCS